MRISDWSSDVCSSDLPATAVSSARQPVIEVQTRAKLRSRGWPPVSIGPSFLIYRGRVGRSEERRVGKSVSVRVDLGGRRIIKKKKNSSHVVMQSQIKKHIMIQN